MLAPLTPAEHRWEQSKTEPGVIQRRGLGVESVLGRKEANIAGHNDLRIIVNLSVSNTTPSLSTLKEKLEDALLELRFQHPESALTLAWDEGVVAPRFQYRSPASQHAARNWAQGLVHVQASTKTGLEVWGDIEEQRLSAPRPDEPISVYLVADVADEYTPLLVGTAVDMVCGMNHVFWDGVSARAFVGDVLKTFSRTLAEDYKVPVYEWGKEIANLSTPILDALKPGVDYTGDDFTADREEFLKACDEGHGDLGTKISSGPYAPRIVTHIFTPEESGRMIKAIKSRLGPKYTITHLGQAATTQAMLEINPPSADLPGDASFVTPISMNGRRWLDDASAASFYAACLTSAVVKFNNVKSLIVDPSDKAAVVQALTRGCEDVKQSFDLWLGKPHHLPVGIAVHNFSADLMAANDKNPAQDKEVAAPVRDGLNDRYLPREVVRGDTGEALMAVNGVLFVLNEPNPFLAVRLESWQGASTLSIDYNGGRYSREQAEAFLRSVAKYMLVFAEV
ncbi:trichothecene 15-O-acetyltransferase [Aspergillus hancockii]|nr:trichothecene 15-O-acetyltransferase [Aspergillus hancockii]